MEKLTFPGYCELLWLGNYLHEPKIQMKKNGAQWNRKKYDEYVQKCTKWS